jgi:hypothetical protein
VEQIPADVFEILELLGRIDGEREIAAALGRAILAKDLAFREFVAFDNRETETGGHRRILGELREIQTVTLAFAGGLEKQLGIYRTQMNADWADSHGLDSQELAENAEEEFEEH